MNVWVVIIIAVPVLALFFFGENPARRFYEQQKAMMEKYGHDELTIATNLYIERQQGGGGGFWGGESSAVPNENEMKSSMRDSAVMNIGEELPSIEIPAGRGISSSRGGSDSVKSSVVATVAKSDDSMYEEDGYIGITTKGRLNSVNGSSRMSGNQGYYPPIVQERTSTHEDEISPIVLTGKESKLRSGQVISFEGVMVYVVDSNGNRKPLPDGSYALQDGGSITVSNGKSILRD